MISIFFLAVIKVSYYCSVKATNFSGLYYLNLKLLHEEEMVRLLQRKVSWMHITENTLITLTGNKNPQLYSHELLGLIQQKNTIKRIPEQFIPKRSLPLVSVSIHI